MFYFQKNLINTRV